MGGPVSPELSPLWMECGYPYPQFIPKSYPQDIHRDFGAGNLGLGTPISEIGIPTSPFGAGVGSVSPESGLGGGSLGLGTGVLEVGVWNWESGTRYERRDRVGFTRIGPGSGEDRFFWVGFGCG